MSKSETLTLICIFERSNGLPGGVKAPKYPAEHLVTGLSREQWKKVICVGWLTFWFDQIGEIVGIGLMDFLSIVFYGACQPEILILVCKKPIFENNKKCRITIWK